MLAREEQEELEVMDWNQRLDGHPKQRGKEEANKANSRKKAL